MKHTFIATAISLALTANSALAETTTQYNDEESIEKLVVVSSRVAMPLREIATSVSVVSKEEIEARGYANLTDVLKNQPSIGATNSGGIGSTTALRVRGEEGYRTLVRVDGVDISDPTSTQVQPQLAHLQSANVSRVEILRGSQGLAYGADAGGVINVQSGNYTESLAGSVSGEFGRYDTRNLAADIGGNNDLLNYYVSASDYKTNGFNSRLDDTTQDNDGYENTTIHSRLGFQLNEELTLNFVARNNQGSGQFDNCGFGATASNDCLSEFEQTNVRAELNYVLDNTENKLAYAKTLIKRENFNQSASSFLTKGTLERAEFIGHADIDADNRLVYGFDWEKETITTAEQSRNSTGYYVEYQGEWVDNLYLTAGVRHDKNDDFGEHTSFRLSGAYIWQLGNNELKLRSAYGTGFRAPSLFEIEYNRGPFAFPPASNVALKEEKTKGYEVALEYSTENGSRFEAVYFDQKIDDSIFFDLAGFSGYIQDLGQATSDGIELIADVQVLDNLSINANYTYNDTKDTEGNQRLRRPKNLANIGLYFALNQFTISANVRHVEDFVDTALLEDFTRANLPLESYQVIDLSARYQVSPQLQVFARVENLFDKKYQDLFAFHTQGESPYVGVKYQF